MRTEICLGIMKISMQDTQNLTDLVPQLGQSSIVGHTHSVIKDSGPK